MEKMEKPAFGITQHKGFRIRFDNGFSVSVQWGPGNYCSLLEKPNDFDAPQKSDYWAANTAEIAVFDPDENWTTKTFFPEEFDDVVGHLTANEVAELLLRVSKA